MKALIISAFSLTLLVATAAIAQDAPAKPKRPTMCMTGQPVAGNGFAGWLCLDGKRPRIFTRYIEVKFVDSEGKAATYVLGWTSPVVKSNGGFKAAPKPERSASLVTL